MKTLSPHSKILVTGAAGFIGYHLTTHLQRMGCRVVGVDRCAAVLPFINQKRMQMLRDNGVAVECCNLAVPTFVAALLAKHRADVIVHLAAHANVRSADAPFHENIASMVNLLQNATLYPPRHFLYASSSSVYGEHTLPPFCESAELRQPPSIYARSKLTGERIANVYADNSKFPITGMRFFNVYGAWGRPQMAPFRFADALSLDEKVPIINGNTSRTWTYIDDVIRAIVALASTPPALADGARIVNVAGPHLVKTMSALYIIAELMGKVPVLEDQPSNIVEVAANPADLRKLKSIIGWVPQTVFEDGIAHFLKWHQEQWQQLALQQQPVQAEV